MRGIDEYYLYVRDNHIRLPLDILYGLDETESVSVPFSCVLLLPFEKACARPTKKANTRRFLRLGNFICKLVDLGLVDYYGGIFIFTSGKIYIDFVTAAVIWLKSLK